MSLKNEKLEKVITFINSSIHSVIEKIDKNGVRGVFVCDEDGELLGIVMDSEIRRAVLRNLDLNATVKTIMRTLPFVINHDVPTEEKKKLLIKSDKILAPIVDKQKRLVDFMYLPDILGELFDANGPGNNDQDSGVLPPQRVLVVGGAGYIGSMLVDKLLRMGYKVRILDLLLYGKESIKNLEGEGLEFVRGDCRDEKTVSQVLDGVGAVVHLGEIVGDPACKINEPFTIDTNYTATHMIVEQCVKSQVSRFIFSSSCSVYGHNDFEVNEEAALNPISLYARCKMESEEAILSHNYNHFCPTILRLATVHGRSHRQRFDLVVNLLAIKALTEKKIQIFGGDQWRPLVSVSDVCNGIIQVLHSEGKKVKNQIFNLGDTRENYQLVQIGDIVKEILPEVQVEVLKSQSDSRNYRVSFKKIKNKLGFTCEYKLLDSVKEIALAYRNEGSFHNYQDSQYHNFLSLK